jgi:hypothetical protein
MVHLSEVMTVFKTDCGDAEELGTRSSYFRSDVNLIPPKLFLINYIEINTARIKTEA